MIAIDNNMPKYRGSRGYARFVQPSGQEVIIRADDEVVIAELKRRNIWHRVSPSVELRTTFVFTDKTPAGMDVFAWIGHADDGGFLWYAFPGATESTPEYREFWMVLTAQVCGGSVSVGTGGGVYDRV
jgi:hypothetical protein